MQRESNYYFISAGQVPQYPALSGDMDCDVCIIGGGFCGLATAYFLQGSGLNVAVIERERFGYGASGRNGGQIIPGFSASVSEVASRYGMEIAKALWQESVVGLEAVKTICKTHAIDTDMKPGTAGLACSAREAKSMPRYAEMLQKEYGQNAIFKNKAEIGAMLGTDYYHGACYFPDSAHFHPYKYICGLARVLAGQGVQLFEQTAALSLSKNTTGYTVQTGRAAIKCKKLVLCGDSYLGDLVPELRRKYVLIRNVIIATDPQDQSVIPADIAGFEDSASFHFFRKNAEGAMLFGGGEAVLHSRNDGATDEKIGNILRNDLALIYPRLKNAEIRHQWGGYIGMTSTFLPNVSETQGGVYYASGFSGHGVNMTHAAARILAGMVKGEIKAGANDNPFSVIGNMSFPGLGRFDPFLAQAGFMLHVLKRKFG